VTTETRLDRLEQRFGRGNCPACRDWPAFEVVTIDRPIAGAGGDDLPPARHCERCGRGLDRVVIGTRPDGPQ
jgi:hypothetical protein